MNKPLPEHTRVIIIGGGVIGCSVAYHLAKRGWRDVVVLERLQLTHGTTWHAAGLVGQLRSSSNLTRLMRYGAQLYVQIIQNIVVKSLVRNRRRVTGVVTDRGRVTADHVVNAAGMWGDDVARMVGTRVPVGALEHQYLVTEKTDRIPADLPTLRDPDARFYVKPEPGALCVGGWEDATVPFGEHGMPMDFGPELLQPNFDRFEQYGVDAANRIPYLNEVGVRQLVNGPIPITADGEPIIGQSPELDNFYLCCGFTSGIAASGGAGSVMANWIIDGDPGMDLWPFDVRRFGPPHVVKRYMLQRAIESYANDYSVAFPHHEVGAGRDARRSPLHRLLKDKGAVYGNKFAWERPNWFAPSGMPAKDTPSFERTPEFDIIGQEHRAEREGVALIDMTSFSKYELRGPGALAVLQKLAGNDMDRPLGTVVYTQLLNANAGIEADVTITRLADERFYFVTGSALGVRDRSVIERHLPADASVQLIDHTSARAVTNICGPRSREVLSRLTDAPLDNQHFAYMSAQELDLGFAPVLALRVTYFGELGWELHVASEYATHLYEQLVLAGAPLGIKDVGYRAVAGLRLEKHYLAWGSDITPDYNPYDAGLGFCVALEKEGEFLARAALQRIKNQGPKQRLCWFTAAPELQLFGGEVVFLNDRVMGSAKSAGYGYTVGRNILCAYLPVEDATHTEYSLEVMGERFPIVRHARPLYDPERKRCNL